MTSLIRLLGLCQASACGNDCSQNHRCGNMSSEESSSRRSFLKERKAADRFAFEDRRKARLLKGGNPLYIPNFGIGSKRANASMKGFLKLQRRQRRAAEEGSMPRRREGGYEEKVKEENRPLKAQVSSSSSSPLPGYSFIRPFSTFSLTSSLNSSFFIHETGSSPDVRMEDQSATSSGSLKFCAFKVEAGVDSEPSLVKVSALSDHQPPTSVPSIPSSGEDKLTKEELNSGLHTCRHSCSSSPSSPLKSSKFLDLRFWLRVLLGLFATALFAIILMLSVLFWGHSKVGMFPFGVVNSNTTMCGVSSAPLLLHVIPTCERPLDLGRYLPKSVVIYASFFAALVALTQENSLLHLLEFMLWLFLIRQNIYESALSIRVHSSLARINSAILKVGEKHQLISSKLELKQISANLALKKEIESLMKKDRFGEDASAMREEKDARLASSTESETAILRVVKELRGRLREYSEYTSSFVDTLFSRRKSRETNKQVLFEPVPAFCDCAEDAEAIVRHVDLLYLQLVDEDSITLPNHSSFLVTKRDCVIRAVQSQVSTGLVNRLLFDALKAGSVEERMKDEIRSALDGNPVWIGFFSHSLMAAKASDWRLACLRKQGEDFFRWERIEDHLCEGGAQRGARKRLGSCHSSCQ